MQLQSKCFNLAHLSHWNKMLMLAVLDNIGYNTALIVGHIPGQTFLFPPWKIPPSLPQLNSQNLQQVKHTMTVWAEDGLCYQHPGAFFTAPTNPYMSAGQKAWCHYTQTPDWQSQPVSSSQGQQAHSEDSVPKAFKHLNMEVKRDLRRARN